MFDENTKLIQKKLFKGSQEFEIVDDAVNVRIKTSLKEDKCYDIYII